MRGRKEFAVLALAAGVIAGGLATASAANATPVPRSCVAKKWGTTGTAADAKGVYTHGDVCVLTDGDRVLISGSIEDTKGDGKAACAQLHATYSSGSTRDEWLYVAGATSDPKGFSYTFASSTHQIWVREGLGNNGSCTQMAGGVHVIYPK